MEGEQLIRMVAISLNAGAQTGLESLILYAINTCINVWGVEYILAAIGTGGPVKRSNINKSYVNKRDSYLYTCIAHKQGFCCLRVG